MTKYCREKLQRPVAVDMYYESKPSMLSILNTKQEEIVTDEPDQSGKKNPASNHRLKYSFTKSQVIIILLP